MMILTGIVIYLIIGSLMGLRDSEMIEGIFKKEFDNVSGLTKKFAMIIALIGIILTAPVVDLVAIIKTIRTEIKLKIQTYRLRRLIKKMKKEQRAK